MSDVFMTLVSLLQEKLMENYKYPINIEDKKLVKSMFINLPLSTSPYWYWPYYANKYSLRYQKMVFHDKI